MLHIVVVVELSEKLAMQTFLSAIRYFFRVKNVMKWSLWRVHIDVILAANDVLNEAYG